MKWWSACLCCRNKQWWKHKEHSENNHGECGKNEKQYEMSNIFKRAISIQSQQNPMHMTEEELFHYIIG